MTGGLDYLDGDKVALAGLEDGLLVKLADDGWQVLRQEMSGRAKASLLVSIAQNVNLFARFRRSRVAVPAERNRDLFLPTRIVAVGGSGISETKRFQVLDGVTGFPVKYCFYHTGILPRATWIVRSTAPNKPAVNSNQRVSNFCQGNRPHDWKPVHPTQHLPVIFG